MKIKSLYIDNFKSLVDFKLEAPNPFTVFVGANGVGKSNVFEALEFFNISHLYENTENLFGGSKSFLNFNTPHKQLIFELETETYKAYLRRLYNTNAQQDETGIIRPFSNGPNKQFLNDYTEHNISTKEFHQLEDNFSRIFINTKEQNKLNLTSNKKLNFNCDNLELVLERVLQNDITALEMKEWLNLFRPGFHDIKVVSNELSDTKSIQFYEQGYDKPFNKKLISDGTYNILCLLTAIYQTDEPQFICIEEPENGLNPYVIKELVTFFREQCEEKGHYIWLNTHSQTLVNQLKPEEIIVLNKENGVTTPKQFKGKDMHGMPMDEAWLTNVFGGGVPW